jgi:hypothetical protein
MSTLDAQTASNAGEIPSVSNSGSMQKSSTTKSLSREALYARAAAQLRLGKWIIIAGFGLLLLGVVTYCVASIGGEPAQEPGLLAGTGAAWVSLAGQAAMAAGMLAWLLGCFVHLWGALDSDPEGPDLYF